MSGAEGYARRIGWFPSSSREVRGEDSECKIRVSVDDHLGHRSRIGQTWISVSMLEKLPSIEGKEERDAGGSGEE